MGVKKTTLFLLIVILTLSGYFYLKGKYNAMAVELSIRGHLTNEEFKEIKEKFHLESYSINYRTSYKGNKLIMTSGMDTQIRDIKVIHGEYISDIQMPVTVIGDKVANRYFNIEDAIGKKLNVFGREYEIIGIVKGSNTIYIPFNKELLVQDWRKKTISYVIPESNMFYIIIEKVNSEINAKGIEIIDMVVYKEKINGYLNLFIVLLVGILVKYIYQLIKNLGRELLFLWNGYKKVRRTTEWSKYILNKRKYLLKTVIKMIVTSLSTFGVFKIASYISIPPTLIPDNFFSLMSYKNVIETNYNKLLLNLENGFSEIAIDSTIINIIIFAVIGVSIFKIKVRN